MPALLIVVPTLSSWRLLPRLLHSLQDQTWFDWRLLFVDGPSVAEHQNWLDGCCIDEHRCRWVEQDPVQPGIFGAMNQGFAAAAPDDWVMFWGSDDWAAGSNVLEEALSAIESASRCPDLLVCRGRYVDAHSGALSRPAVFHVAGLLTANAYRREIFLGSTPPHQATLIGPGARRYLSRYAPGFRLSADLDYFLQLRRKPGLLVQCLNVEIVHMGDAGISGQQTLRRLQEVSRAYVRAFGLLWWFPFVARYIRRFASLLSHH